MTTTSEAAAGGAAGVGAKVLLAIIGTYRGVLSPMLAPHCRFYPSCSAYAEQALREHGLTRGTGLAARRLLHCHPFNPGGFDPVPRSTGVHR